MLMVNPSRSVYRSERTHFVLQVTNAKYKVLWQTITMINSVFWELHQLSEVTSRNPRPAQPGASAGAVKQGPQEPCHNLEGKGISLPRWDDH